MNRHQLEILCAVAEHQSLSWSGESRFGDRSYRGESRFGDPGGSIALPLRSLDSRLRIRRR